MPFFGIQCRLLPQGRLDCRSLTPKLSEWAIRSAASHLSGLLRPGLIFLGPLQLLAGDRIAVEDFVSMFVRESDKVRGLAAGLRKALAAFF